MATKQYRLLRNNKESGPYTADQMIGLGLKPYDLVWLDGRSAAWRYPCEMDEFKAYALEVEEQPYDRFFKKAGNIKADNILSTVQPVVQTATLPAVNPKPRIRIKADWNQIVQPTAEALQTPVTTKEPVQQPAKQMESADANWQNAWLDWQKNQNAVGQASKKGAANAANVAPLYETEPVAGSKFKLAHEPNEPYTSPFLDSFGKKSAKWNKHKRMATLILAAIPVLGFSIWIGTAGNGDSDPKKAQPATGNIVPVAGVASTAQPANNNNTDQAETPVSTPLSRTATPKAKAYAKEVIPDFEENAEKKPGGENTKKPAAPLHTPGERKYGTQVNQQASAALQTQQKAVTTTQQHYNFTAPVDAGPSSRNKVVNPSLLAAGSNNADRQNGQQEVANQYSQPKKAADNSAPVFRHAPKQQKTEDFVSVDAEQPSGQNVQNLALKVENVTDAAVDLVVIDVQYYDGYGKFKSGQTIYVKNIPVDQTVKVKVPDNAFASRIKYRVSLVSVEQKGVYLVAE